MCKSHGRVSRSVTVFWNLGLGYLNRRAPRSERTPNPFIFHLIQEPYISYHLQAVLHNNNSSFYDHDHDPNYLAL